MTNGWDGYLGSPETEGPELDGMTVARLKTIALDKARVYTRNDSPKEKHSPVSIRLWEWMIDAIDEFVATKTMREYKTRSDFIFDATMHHLQYIVETYPDTTKTSFSAITKSRIRQLQHSSREEALEIFSDEIDLYTTRGNQQALRAVLDDLHEQEKEFDGVADRVQMMKLRDLITRCTEALGTVQ
jgi:metal-responsive CopG/Arc/MetJ family transcriptional regulator